jgi:peptidoglycan hydrolase-like protein with peptidoglycan-binding domain
MAKKKPAKRRRRTPVYEESGFNLKMPAIVRDRPLDSFALFLSAGVAVAISVNALFLQGGVTINRDVPVAAPAPRQAASPAAVAAASSPAPQQAANPDDTNMLVREVQSELTRRGLYDGPADGKFGPKTEAAIFDFEIGAGLKPTGRPNPQVLAAMRASNQPSIVASPRVAAVQRALVELKFGPVTADGVFGEATRAAIRRFEASRGLPQKGEITPSLMRQLSTATGTDIN